MKRRHFILGIALSGLFFFCWAGRLSAQAVKPRKDVLTREVFGTVSGISNNFIAVVYGRDARTGVLSEMAFNVGKEATIKNKKALKEINPEDSVKVIYDEITEIKEDGRILKSRVAKEVIFLRPAEKRADPEPDAEPQKQIEAQ